MMSITSTRYLSNVDWLQDVVQGTDLILCGVSALEYLELFNGYVNESKIQVYSLIDPDALLFFTLLCVAFGDVSSCVSVS